MPYLYELATTGAISFADFCVDQSVGKWYATYISDATQARANVRSVLKDNKRTDLGEKDYLKLVKVCARAQLFESMMRITPSDTR